MDQSKKALNNEMTLIILVAITTFASGLTIGLVVNNRQSETTVQTCRDALELDDEIFMRVGSHIGAYDFTGAATYLQGATPERHSLYAGCMEA